VAQVHYGTYSLLIGWLYEEKQQARNKDCKYYADCKTRKPSAKNTTGMLFAGLRSNDLVRDNLPSGQDNLYAEDQ
jgi:hypothetical protein